MKENGTKLRTALLTGGKDIHYAFGLLSGLVDKDIEIEMIGNDQWKSEPLLERNNVHYFNLRGDQRDNAPVYMKIFRVLLYYYKLMRYAASSNASIFHIQWLNKFTLFDRTVLNLFYKIFGKKLVFTAHDINYRDLVGKDSFINRWSLIAQYKIVDHLVVHTDQMKNELVKNYKVSPEKISIIPFGINEVMPNSQMTSAEARARLEFDESEKVLLFFGNIAPYKGIEYLIEAMNHLHQKDRQIRLVVAGRVKVNCQDYWAGIQEKIDQLKLREVIIERIEYIPENEAEIYFKAADLLVLPYRNIFQSGLIYTSYRFGLPVVATNVGSLRQDIIEGKTGFVATAESPDDIAEKILKYFNSDLYRRLPETRIEIIAHGETHHSWKNTGEKTFQLYQSLTASR